MLTNNEETLTSNHSNLVDYLIKYLRLTPIESEVYVCLISLGGCNAKEMLLNINRKRIEIYRTLNRLVEMGIACKTSTSPTFYKPNLPLKIIDDKIYDYKKRINGLNFLYDNLKDYDLKKNSNMLLNIWLISSEELINRYITNIIRNAKNYVIYILSDNMINELYNPYYDIMSNNENLKVDIKLIIKDECIYPDLEYNVDIINKNLNCFFVGVDYEKLIMKIRNELGEYTTYFGEDFQSYVLINSFMNMLLKNGD